MDARGPGPAAAPSAAAPRRRRAKVVPLVGEEWRPDGGVLAPPKASELPKYRRKVEAVRLWHNNKLLHAQIAAKYRHDARGHIPHPNHVCTPACRLKPLSTALVRFDDGGEEDFFESIKRGEVVNTESVHICFKDACVHHRCGYQKSTTRRGFNWVCYAPDDAEVGRKTCPHSLVQTRENIREIKHVWACPRSATVHFCGDNCIATQYRREPTHELVCSLTNMIVGNAVEVPGVFGRETGLDRVQYNNLLEYTAYTRGGTAAAPLLIEGPKKRARAKDDDVMLADIRGMITALFFSRERQIAEARRIMSAIWAADLANARSCRRFASMTAAARTPDDMPAVGLEIASVGRYPTSRYFNVCGIRPDCLAEISKIVSERLGPDPQSYHEAILAAVAMRRQADHVLPRRRQCAARCPKSCPQCRARDFARRHADILRTVRRTHSFSPDQTGPSWEWASIAERRATITEMGARAILTVWKSVLAYITDKGDDASRSQERFCPVLITMLAGGFAIPACNFSGIARTPATEADLVTIVPDLIHPDLVPDTNTVYNLPISTTSKTSLASITSMTKIVREVLNAIAARADPSDLRTSGAAFGAAFEAASGAAFRAVFSAEKQDPSLRRK